MRFTLSVLMLLAVAAPIEAQLIPPTPKTVSLSGPRFGVTVLSDGVVAKLAERDISVTPVITQFGWQLEKQFFSTEGGLTAVTEWVGLIGGLEQDDVLPSLSWMVGLRTRDGAEFGVGPNLTPAGTALAIAAGVTVRAGVLNIPMNIAIVPSKAGTRVSVLTGFNMRRRATRVRPVRYDPCPAYALDRMGRPMSVCGAPPRPF